MKQLLLLSALTLLFAACSETASTDTSKDEAINQTEDVKTASPWRVAGSVDEFGDKVEGEANVTAKFKGQMSNSATTSSEMEVEVIISDMMLLGIYEYGRSLASLPSNEFFAIKVKMENDSTDFVRVFSTNNVLVDADGDLMEKLLNQKKPLKVSVDLSRANQYLSSKYNFEIDPNGLSDIISEAGVNPKGIGGE